MGRKKQRERMNQGVANILITGLIEAGGILLQTASQRKGQGQITESAIMIPPSLLVIAQAAELSLKLVFEEEQQRVAPDGHDLYKLYQKLSPERKEKIEAAYVKAISTMQLTEGRPIERWATAAETFKSEKDSFIEWRYLPQTKALLPTTMPGYLLAAARSVFFTLPYAGKLPQAQQRAVTDAPPEVRRKLGLD